MHNVAGVQLAIVEGSSVPISVTGTTAEVEVARITLPPYGLGTAGLLRLFGHAAHTNNANAKTLRLRLGSLAGTLITSTGIAASQASTQFGTHVWVRPSTIVLPASMAGWFTANTVATATQANDWSTPTDIILSMQLAVGTDTWTLHGVQWEGFKF